jgi:WD40 repeat protein
MATAVTAPPTLDSSPEKINGWKLRRLIVDGGTRALITIFNKQLAGNSLKKFLLAKTSELRSLLTRKVINQTQFNKLFPGSSIVPDINTFDITLLSSLLQNIGGLISPPTDGWYTKPNASDTSDGANILRIRHFRNELHAHISETGISTKYFELYWNEVSSLLVNMGLDQKDIDRLKEEETGKDVVERVMNAWNAMEGELLQISRDTQETSVRVYVINEDIKGLKRVGQETLAGIKHIQESQQKKCKFSQDIHEVLKTLAKCDFTSERAILCNRFLDGTRGWVFEQVNEWLNDSLSEKRTFIISGIAGMGKSVIAAVICEKLKQQLAGCHFCSHGNDQYYNPKILLQSIARQICNVLPEFRQALINQLSQNLGGRRIENMNIEGLFTTLLREPFSQIGYPGKIFLIVIDGVDECDDSKARHEFVDLIASYLPKLPNFIRFLITTRPEMIIDHKFRDFHPLCLKKDAVNENDVRLFFENKLSSFGQNNVWIQEHVTKLTSISDGLMLHAFFLSEYFEQKQVFENLPTGLNHVFQMHFRRLENECKKVLEINEENFLSLLSAMVVARKPLPFDFVCGILGVKTGTPSEKRNIVKARSCISSLFVITDDHVSFFHKSVKDWLVDKSEHSYTIDQKYGHKVLAKQCAECFDKIRGTSVVETPVNSYALEHGFEHMIQDDDKFISYVNSYLVDVEIVYHHISFLGNNKSSCVGQYTDMTKRNKGYSKVAVKTKLKLEKLDEILVRYNFLFFSEAPSFLQLLIYQTTCTEMSSDASSLCKRIYPELLYFEQVSKHDVPVNTKTIALSEQPLTCADFCIPKGYVVLCFESGVVKLLSIKPFEEIWTKTFATDEITTKCIAFHPDKDVVLPGRLDQVLSLIDGSWQEGPFSCEETYFFTDCCFSPDQTFMITCGKNSYLYAWNLASGEKVSQILYHWIYPSPCFSRNGNYLAVVIDNDTCSLYDVRNNYKRLQTVTFEDGDSDLIYTTWKSDSWILLSRYDSRTITIINDEGTYSNSYLLKHEASVTFFPPSGKALANADWSGIFQIQSKLASMLFCRCSYMKRNNISYADKDISTTLLHDEKLLASFSSHLVLLDAIETCGNLSFDGQFFYQHFTYSRQFRIFRRSSGRWILVNGDIQDIITFAIVKNGVLLVSPGKIEIWDVSMLDCLKRCPKSCEIRSCESVSDYLVACIAEAEVNFIDSRTLEIQSKTSLSGNQEVLACSSKCDVVVRDISDSNWKCFIMRDNHKSYPGIYLGDVHVARFPPDASLLLVIDVKNCTKCLEISETGLAMTCDDLFEMEGNSVYIFDNICFVDNKHFIIYFYMSAQFNEHVLSFERIPRYEEPLCLPICDYPTSLFYNRETATLIVNYLNCNFEELKLH